MAIYLPKQKIVIDVVDDPCRDAIDAAAFPGLAVLPLTCEEFAALEPAEVERRALAPACWPGSPNPGGEAA